MPCRFTEEAYAVFDALCKRESASPDWANTKETVQSELALCRSQAEKDGRSQSSGSTRQDI